MIISVVLYPVWAVKWQWYVCEKCQTQVIRLQPINRRWHIFTAHIIICQQMHWGERERTETVHLVARNKTLFVLIIKQGRSYSTKILWWYYVVLNGTAAQWWISNSQRSHRVQKQWMYGKSAGVEMNAHSLELPCFLQFHLWNEGRTRYK